MRKITFQRLYRSSLYLFAFVVLFSAIAITLVRLALPEIGGYRQQTQDWISQYMNYPVEISNIDADWNSWTPNLHLHQVSILDPVLKEPILNFNSVLISIDIFRSLVRNEITPETITVSDLSLTLIRRQDGSITASKYLPNQFNDKQLNNDSLAKWFLAQKNILVKKAQITLFDLNDDDEPLLLSDVTLHMRNNDYRTQIEGSAILPDYYGHILNFAFDATGDVLTPDWSGEMYFEGKSINISPLLAEIEDLDIQDHEGTGDIKIWSTWNRAKLRKIEGEVKLYELTLADQQSKIYIQKIAGQFIANRRADKGVEFSFDLEELITPYGEWPKTIISLRKIYVHDYNKYRYTASASYLNLDDIDPFLKIFPSLSNKFSSLNNFELSGTLKNSVLKYDPTLETSEQVYFESEFSHLNGEFNVYSLRLDGLNGHVQGTQGSGSLRIESSSIQLESENLLFHPLTFYELNTELAWEFQNNNLFLSTELLDTHTHDFNLKLKGDLEFNQDKSLPFVDILLELSNGELDKVVNYLPAKTPEKVSNWLKNSLVTGEIPSAKFIFRGWLEEYPFNHREGIFQGLAKVNHGTLDYHPAWPPIDKINADVIFNGDSLTVDASSGNFFDAEITEVSAVLKNLAAKGLKKSVSINGHINGELKDGLLFIKNSPLQKNQSLKNLLSQNISGSLGLDLILDIPLPSGSILVSGALSLHDTLLDSEDIGIKLTELNGTIDFTQNSVLAEGIEAFYFNHPVELSVTSIDGSPTKSTLSGSADKQFISAQLLHHFPALDSLKAELEKRITGSCLWEASIINTKSHNPNNHSNIKKQLVITSTLGGLSLDLPAPLSKTDESTSFKLSIKSLDGNQREINIQYADILNGIINLDESNSERSVITPLPFGDHPIAVNKGEQISIIGNIKHLVADEWFDLIQKKANDGNLKANDKPVSLDIEIGSLKLINQNFHNVGLKLNNVNSDYQLNIQAEDVSGDIYLGQLADNMPIEINLQKLNLVKNEPEDASQKQTYKIIPDTIPSLNIEISELVYDDIKLGQMNLITSKLDNGLSVDKINIQKTSMEIDGTGTWQIINNEHHSNFKLALNTASMKTMLETFNYDVAAIEEGETNLTLNAQWEGTPIDFSPINLNGTLDMKIEKGRFTDVNPAAGRLFGLLSLQTLPRRLSLDFSDLFGKGLAFDNIEGHFSIENGNAYTNNLIMSGPSVDINISGRTGLVEQDYDQIATITPKMTNSLPMASAIFGPIGIGVGAVIYLASEVFQSIPEKIDTLLRKQYSITGAWNTPKVTKIKRGEEFEKKEKKNNS